MRTRSFRLLLAALLCVATAGASALVTPPSKPGAKELFYDPTSGDLASVEKDDSAKAPSNRTKAARSGTQASPAVDGTGRRVSKPPVAPSTTTTQATAGPAPLGLSYWIELETPGGEGTQVTESRTFRSGERIRLHFRSNAEGRIALVQLGASGTATVLFPDARQGLVDDLLRPNEDRVLPSAGHWFRFDDRPGTERLLVLFGSDATALQRFPLRPAMDPTATVALLESTQPVRGSKDLLIETEVRQVSEIGTYGVNLAGQPVILEIKLEHR